MFSKQLIEYTQSTFKESKIDIMTGTMVKEVHFIFAVCTELRLTPSQKVKDQSVMLQMPDKTLKEVPCGMVVWAAVSRKIFFQRVRIHHVCQGKQRQENYTGSNGDSIGLPEEQAWYHS